MAKNLRLIKCRLEKTCRKCGSEIKKASVKNHYVCMANNCDSGIFSIFGTSMRVAFSSLPRAEISKVAFNVGTVKITDVYDAKAARMKLEATATHIGVWYCDSHNLPLISTYHGTDGILGFNYRQAPFTPSSGVFYIAGTDRKLQLMELPMVHCTLEIRQHNKKRTWPEICSQTFFEEDDAWMIGQRFRNPHAVLNEEVIEKILLARFEGKQVFHTQQGAENLLANEKKSSSSDPIDAEIVKRLENACRQKPLI